MELFPSPQESYGEPPAPILKPALTKPLSLEIKHLMNDIVTNQFKILECERLIEEEMTFIKENDAKMYPECQNIVNTHRSATNYGDMTARRME